MIFGDQRRGKRKQLLLEEIAVAKLEPGDLLLYAVGRQLSADDRIAIIDQLHEVLPPGVRVLVHEGRNDDFKAVRAQDSVWTRPAVAEPSHKTPSGEPYP